MIPIKDGISHLRLIGWVKEDHFDVFYFPHVYIVPLLKYQFYFCSKKDWKIVNGMLNIKKLFPIKSYCHLYVRSIVFIISFQKTARKKV